ncbi:MAG TPA: epoxyqueuosine reductase, partial [Nitrospirota bacterium]|nr:epoxyqueuosine reductase [Nitrospirota bacterium]
PLIGNRVFGCDDCQWACPYNKGTAVSTETSFVPRKELTFPRLIALMEMGAGDFKGLFYKNPVLRVKRNRFLRNVAVALGNSGDQRAVPDLEKRLNDPDITIREHVEWAINRLLKAQ